uniref:progestin and adipoQ receptor family member 3a isoform X1 n=1 Tax=Doryrhamphus excisus TaxID=161450 RepID=UPI0025AE536B|nr:progestin and adipoQ receptor family member 3a isoform X1 [Doryrhamphus excisus]
MPQKIQKNSQTAHYIELGGYQYWPVLVPSGIRLYTYEQIPGFLRENPYITDGYRAYLPSRLCIKSLFVLSNETVNIWSHLLGFLLFFCLAVYNMACVLPELGASREDYVIYSIGLFCVKLCLLCSVGYHLFCCHRSEKTSRRWMALDYAGVSIGILGCYVPGVFYTFYCNNRKVMFPPSSAVSCSVWAARPRCNGGCFAVSVLASGVPGDGAGDDPGRLLRPDPPPLPRQAVEEAPLAHLLLGGVLRPGAHRALDLHRRRLLGRAGAGLCSPRAAHVLDGGVGAGVLRVQSTRTLLPRPAELRGLQPPGVARAAAAHVLLVAPVLALHHGVPTQPAVPGRRHALVAATSAYALFLHMGHFPRRGHDRSIFFLSFHVEYL